MKIKIEADVTPEELRKFFGLPDVEGLQQEMLEQMRKNIANGAEGFDPVLLMKPWLPESMQSMNIVQKGLWETLRQASGSNKAEDEEEKSPPKATRRTTSASRRNSIKEP